MNMKYGLKNEVRISIFISNDIYKLLKDSKKKLFNRSISSLVAQAICKTYSDPLIYMRDEAIRMQQYFQMYMDRFNELKQIEKEKKTVISNGFGLPKDETIGNQEYSTGDREIYPDDEPARTGTDSEARL